MFATDVREENNYVSAIYITYLLNIVL